jgi:LytS/YehU family sensor histidine kinase
MRYVITETNQKFVPLEKEIEYINNYIDLQKLRLTENVKLYYTVTGDISGKQIAPLMLIPFVENAFKHGVSPDENSAIQVKISVANDTLKMEVKNNKISLNIDTIGKSGLGIANAKNRFQLLYPNQHDLTISETNKTFNVTLKINL